MFVHYVIYSSTSYLSERKTVRQEFTSHYIRTKNFSEYSLSLLSVLANQVQYSIFERSLDLCVVSVVPSKKLIFTFLLYLLIYFSRNFQCRIRYRYIVREIPQQWDEMTASKQSNEMSASSWNSFVLGWDGDCNEWCDKGQLRGKQILALETYAIGIHSVSWMFIVYLFLSSKIC